MAEDAEAGFGPPVNVADAGFGPPVEPTALIKPPTLAPGETVGTPEEPAPEGFGPSVKPAGEEKPMPSVIDALLQGVRAGVTELPESAKALRGEQPAIAPETTPAAAPFAWSDVTSPSRIMPKVAYGLGKGAPTIAAGIAGGVAGSPLGPGGTLAGGAAGAGLGAAFQAVGPYFSEELKKSPNDPEGAWNSAMERAGASGAFSALGWAAFPVRLAQGPLKQLAFQAFGIQPAVSVAEQATQNILQGKPATENLGQAYAQGAAFTAIPMAGHAALGALGRGERPTVSPTTPPQTVGDVRRAIGEHEQRLADLQQTLDGKRLVDHYNIPIDQATDDIRTGVANEKDEVAARLNDLKKQFATSPDKDDMAPAYREIDVKAPVPGAGPDPSMWDRFSFGQHVKNAIYAWQKLFQPERVSDLALQAFGEFRNFVAASAQKRDSIINAQEHLHNYFEKLPYEQQIEFMRGAEKEAGFEITPENKPAYDEFRRLLDLSFEADKDVGSKYGYIDEYFPREFVQPDRAAQFINSRIQTMGSPGFQKARTYDFLREGLDAGLVLKNSNPADLVTNRLLGSAAVQEKTKLVQRLNQMGAATMIRSPGELSAATAAGWRLIKTPVGDQWAIHPDLSPMWDNVVADKGLWDNPNTAGNAFRKWMSFKNFYVPIKLALSLFHPLHVSHINLVDALTRGWSQLTEAKDPIGMLGTVAKGVYGQIANAIPYLPTEAKAARAAWLTPEWKQTPEQAATVRLMTEGGFSPQLSEQLRQKHSTAFRDALAHQEWFKAIPAGLQAGFSKMTGAIFEHWIPSLKTAAYLDEAKALFERRPDLIDNDIQRKAALSTIAKSVDNRYGEMFYRGLFWNKALKDAGIGSFLSLGWNLGFAREFGGGALEPFLKGAIETPTQQTIRATKSKTAFAFFYMANAMALNAAMTKMMSGEDPEGMDYFLPRIGGVNPDGSPRRVSNMFYTREIPMLSKHIEEQQSVIGGIKSMLWNKMMFEPFHEMMTNRDYYGYNIWDENAPTYQKAWQLGKYIMSDQFSPITITGAKRALQATGKWNEDDSFIQKAHKILTEPEGQLAISGFGPAPSYASKSATLNRLNYLFGRYVSPVERPMKERQIMEDRRDARNALALAQRTGNREAAQQAAQKLHQLGLTSASITKVKPGTQDIYMFQRLPYTAQIDFLKGVSKEEFKRYFPKANKNTRADPDIRSMSQSYYRQ